jgi:hypothetical protein
MSHFSSNQLPAELDFTVTNMKLEKGSCQEHCCRLELL